MKAKTVIKILVDIAMTAALMILMTYELAGAATHEWVGMAMFILFIIHHILNLNWCKNLFHGKYTVLRICQTALAVLVLFSMIGSMASGIILSRHVFDFLSISGGQSQARTLHLLCAYWGYVLMSVHLGLNWNMIMGMAKKLAKKTSKVRKSLLRIAAALIAVYGVYALINRNIISYMFLKNQFVYFDYNEPIYLFMLDYSAIMGLFIFIGYYISLWAKKADRRKAAGL